METVGIGTELEVRRLERRADRIEQVLADLRLRAEYRAEADGRTPPPLAAAIDGFESELDEIRSQMRHLRTMTAAV